MKKKFNRQFSENRKNRLEYYLYIIIFGVNVLTIYLTPPFKIHPTSM